MADRDRVLGALAAAMVGFLDLFAIPPGTQAFRTAVTHMTLNLSVTAAYAGNFAWRQTAGPESRVEIGMLALSVVSLGVLGFSGFLGGELAYRYGVRVADEATQAQGYASTSRPATDRTRR